MEVMKYSSSGNDFLIFHNALHNDGTRPSLAQSMCDRHNGIGADGMVVLIPAANKPYAYEWEFYNADGSCANMCGNASRAVGHYAYMEGIAPSKHSFLSAVGLIGIEVDTSNTSLVQSDLGGWSVLGGNIIESNPYKVSSWTLLDTGVPHLVGFVSQMGDLPKLKDDCLRALRVKYNANITLVFAQKEQIFYMSYERGVEDITLSCGTGAAAAFVMAFENNLCSRYAKLIPPSKEILELRVNEDSHILFKGAVKAIARCEWLL
ncbi:diaminopimelate epimerase [Helicobacter marmotae]|uniref:Diaminopimelate epimerase n=1 Tax=Helicobacter marmotae TaxID=152490 RepID=A0A3D8I227_9HELI|nr:diaminopimelate epimerase [Helicobacter marmotae]RDU59190.1 diaminopimelate epimerase [Helicobacter marmotae]